MSGSFFHLSLPIERRTTFIYLRMPSIKDLSDNDTTSPCPQYVPLVDFGNRGNGMTESYRNFSVKHFNFQRLQPESRLLLKQQWSDPTYICIPNLESQQRFDTSLETHLRAQRGVTEKNYRLDASESG